MTEEKSLSQLATERKARYDKDPDSFVEMSEIIVVIKRVNGGVAHYIGQAKRSELNIAKSELQYQIDQALLYIDSQHNKVITPNKKHFGRGLFKK